MHSDLLERSRIAREAIDVPAFPLASIRAAVARPAPAPARRRSIVAAIVASVSIVAIAAAAEVVQQTRIHFLRQGGLVVSSPDMRSAHDIHSTGEIRAAAARLGFKATIPTGLPDGTIPVRLNTGGKSYLAIDYDLPGIARRSHHMLWIFLADPQTISSQNVSHTSSGRVMRLKMNNEMQTFRAGAEQVIIVSNGLTWSEFAAIKRAMQREAAGGG